MKRFEYLACMVDYRDIDEFLNDRGSEGWELVNAIHFGPPGSEYRLIFKKEVIRAG